MLSKAVSEGIVRELNNLRLNLSNLWALEKISKEEDVPEELNILLAPLERKGLVVNRMITLEGKKLLTSLLNGEVGVSKEFKANVKKMREDFEKDFNNWWETFPRNDTFQIGNKHFQGTRALRSGKKEKNKEEFLKILAEGEYTAAQLIQALEYEVNTRKSESLKQNSNQLKWMKGSLTYLNQRAFEGFIGMVIKGNKVGEVQDNAVNI